MQNVNYDDNDDEIVYKKKSDKQHREQDMYIFVKCAKQTTMHSLHNTFYWTFLCEVHVCIICELVYKK